MCMIIVKDKGLTIPKDKLQQSFSQNHDGFGIIWHDGTELHIIKGMNLSGLMKAVDDSGLNQAIVHCRLATHGNVDLQNCHPFQVTQDLWLVHNGIIDTAPELDNTRSDTWNFCQYILGPILSQKPSLFGTKELESIMIALCGKSNKFVLMNSRGDIQIINKEAGHEENGLWYSSTLQIGIDWSEWEKERPWKKWNKFEDLENYKPSSWSLEELQTMDYEDLLEIVKQEPTDVADAIWTSLCDDKA